jgi:hypothetical protein
MPAASNSCHLDDTVTAGARRCGLGFLASNSWRPRPAAGGAGSPPSLPSRLLAERQRPVGGPNETGVKNTLLSPSP